MQNLTEPIASDLKSNPYGTPVVITYKYFEQRKSLSKTPNIQKEKKKEKKKER